MFILTFAEMKRRRTLIYCGVCIALTGLLVAGELLREMPAGLAGGAEHISIDVLWKLRLPRAVTAILAGAALALAGTQMQSVLRNPLADPHIMGVSSGAALGAASAIMAGNLTVTSPPDMHGIPTAVAAFIGALATSALISTISRKFRHAGTLLIFGVMLGYIINAVISILQFNSDAESLKIFSNWSAGSFASTDWSEISIILIALVIGGIIARQNAKGLDIILFGDEFAAMAGADAGKIRMHAVLSCSILTGAVTAFCGLLGFIGIIAPHIARSIIGSSSHKLTLPATMLTGSILALSADMLSQLSPAPLPIASTLALAGIPIILYILLKKQIF